MLEQIGKNAKNSAVYVRKLGATQKNEILFACADALEKGMAFVLEENTKDMSAADPSRGAFNDRLKLTEDRINAMAEGIRKVARQDDPIGETSYAKILPNGLKVGGLRKRRRGNVY